MQLIAGVTVDQVLQQLCIGRLPQHTDWVWRGNEGSAYGLDAASEAQAATAVKMLGGMER